MRHRLPSLLVLACAALAVPTSPARAAMHDQPARHAGRPVEKAPTISVSGTGRVERAPDYVDVSLGVVAPATTASAAQSAASRAMDAGLKAIRALNLKDADLQTGAVELQPRYEHRPRPDGSGPHEPELVGYTAVIIVRVRTSDLDSVPRVIDAALAAGCNRVDYVSFGIREAIAAREEAIRLAAQAARRKALVLAEALGLAIESVETAGTTSHMGGYYPMNRFSNMAQMESRAAPAGEEAPVVPGKVEVWAEANVTYTARPTDARRP